MNRRKIRDNAARNYWITVAVVVGLFVYALGSEADNDAAAYLVVCPRGTDRSMTCWPP